MREKTNKEVVINFLKKYGYIIGLSIIMLALSIILIVFANKPQANDNNQPVNTDHVTFYSPLLNFTVAKDYNDKNLVYNTTLKQWEAHKGVCFTAPEGSDVFAALDGVVEDVYTNHLDGTVVVLSHNNNLKTYYSSLAKDAPVKKGDTVKKGDVIGKISNTGANELNLGNHLHFEVTENDVKVDPSLYLDLGNK